MRLLDNVSMMRRNITNTFLPVARPSYALGGVVRRTGPNAADSTNSESLWRHRLEWVPDRLVVASPLV